MSAFKVWLMVNYWRIKIAVCTAASLGLQLALIALLLPAYLSLGSTMYFAATLLSSVVMLALLFRWMVASLEKQLAEKPVRFPRAHAAVLRVLKRLCRRTGVNRPPVIVTDSLWGDDRSMSYNAAISEMALCQPILLFGKKLEKLLTEEEGEAILAHECRHARQFEVALMGLLSMLRGVIGLVFFWCALHFIWRAWGLPEMGLGGGFLAVFKAWMLMLALDIPSSLALAMAWRATELKTDALAAQDQGTPEHLISALDKIEEAVERDFPNRPRPVGVLRWFDTHPTTSERARSLRWMALPPARQPFPQGQAAYSRF